MIGETCCIIKLKLFSQLQMEVVELVVHHKGTGVTTLSLSKRRYFHKLDPHRHNSPIGSYLQHKKHGMTV